jgi:hypothetical protein
VRVFTNRRVPEIPIERSQRKVSRLASHFQHQRELTSPEISKLRQELTGKIQPSTGTKFSSCKESLPRSA